MEPAEFAESYDKTDFPAASIRSAITWTFRDFDVSATDTLRTKTMSKTTYPLGFYYFPSSFASTQVLKKRMPSRISEGVR